MYFAITKGADLPYFEAERMFQLRYKVGVEDWGWKLPNVRDNLDIDDFDRPQTDYILVYNDHDEMVACSRLNATTGPHLMSEVFPHQCEFTGVPTGENIWELSRYICLLYTSPSPRDA